MVSPAFTWPAEHETALRALVLAGAGSHSIMADLLNAKFGTSYSRNALIGKASRMGMRITGAPHPVKRKPRREPQPKPARVAKPKPVAVDLPTLRCVEVVPKNVALVDLSSDECRWPYGDGPFHFCGHPQLDGSSYCGPHFALSVGLGTFDERMAECLPREAR